MQEEEKNNVKREVRKHVNFRPPGPIWSDKWRGTELFVYVGGNAKWDFV